MPRELTELQVDFISLVKRPATAKSLLLKGLPIHTFELTKADDEQKRAYGIVYAPDAVDLQGDVANALTIRQAADRFMTKGLQNRVDVEHSFIPEIGKAFVAESWLLRKNDPLFPSETEGAWAVGIQVTDESLWKQLKQNELTGLSLAGTASVIQKDDEYPLWFKEWLQKSEKAKAEEKVDMTEADVRRIVQEMLDAALNKDEKKSEPPPKKGDKEEEDKDAEKRKKSLDIEAISKLLDEKIAPLMKRGLGESGTGTGTGQIREAYL